MLNSPCFEYSFVFYNYHQNSPRLWRAPWLYKAFAYPTILDSPICYFSHFGLDKKKDIWNESYREHIFGTCMRDIDSSTIRLNTAHNTCFPQQRRKSCYETEEQFVYFETKINDSTANTAASESSRTLGVI